MYDTKTNFSNTVLLDLTSFELYSSPFVHCHSPLPETYKMIPYEQYGCKRGWCFLGDHLQYSTRV